MSEVMLGEPDRFPPVQVEVAGKIDGLIKNESIGLGQIAIVGICEIAESHGAHP
jgi:hypothetical protein